MVKRKVTLPNVAGWAGTAAGAFNAHTVTVDIPVGPRYHDIWIYGNAGAAKKATDLFLECRLKINGKAQRTFDFADLLKINALNNVPGGTLAYAGRNGNVAATAFFVPIWLAEPWRKNLGTIDGLAWATGDVGSMTLELDVQAYAGAAAGLIAPTFRARVDDTIVGPGQPTPIGNIVRWEKFQIPITAANAFNDFLGFPRSRDYLAYQSIHLKDANVSDFELFSGTTLMRKDTTAGNAADVAAREMSPDPSATNDCPARAMYDLIFDEGDSIRDALPTNVAGVSGPPLNLRLNESGGTVSRNITAIAEIIGPPA